MTKDKIYQIALVYQNKLSKLEFTLVDTRKMRELFKEISSLATEIEEDRKEIIKKLSNDKSKEEELIKEMETLFKEECEVSFNASEVIEIIEKSGHKLSVTELNALE